MENLSVLWKLLPKLLSEDFQKRTVAGLISARAGVLNQGSPYVLKLHVTFVI